MPTTTARFPTVHASKYLQQLCKHFAHKVEVSYDETRGRVPLVPGPVDLMADATGLSVSIVTADVKDMIHARFVIDSHLVTFAHREGFTGFSWQMEEA